MRFLLLACSMVWLIGCAALPTPQQADWDRHRQQLAALDQWKASGKLAVHSGEEAGTANLEWLQMGKHSHLQLSGPMGLQATRIHSDGDRLHISQGDQETSVDLRQPGALRAHTGWDLPVESLSWWLRGLPAPHSRARETIDQGLLRSLHQDGWHIRFDSYTEDRGYRLPQRLDLERGDTGARLLIRQWRAGEP